MLFFVKIHLALVLVVFCFLLILVAASKKIFILFLAFVYFWNFSICHNALSIVLELLFLMFYQVSLLYALQIRMYPSRQLYIKRRSPEDLNRACSSVPFLRWINKFPVGWRGREWANKCSSLTSFIKANCFT